MPAMTKSHVVCFDRGTLPLKSRSNIPTDSRQYFCQTMVTLGITNYCISLHLPVSYYFVVNLIIFCNLIPKTTPVYLDLDKTQDKSVILI